MKTHTRVKFSMDGSWGVQSYSQSSRSSVGQAAAIGHISRKSLAFSWKSKTCTVCERAITIKKDSSKQFCTQDHNGTIKASVDKCNLGLYEGEGAKGAAPVEMIKDRNYKLHKCVQLAW